MFSSIACLKLKGCGLIFSDRYMLDIMALTASEMLIRDLKKKSLDSDFFSGAMTTKMEYGVIGSTGGYIFFVELESEEFNRVSMEFILSRPIPEEELKRSIWITSIMDEKQEKAAFN